MATKTWHWTDRGAEAASEEWTAVFNPKSPDRGMLLSGRTPPQPHVFRCAPLPDHRQVVEEAYDRQSDLIVRYRQTESDRFSFQLNFRMLRTDRRYALGLEMWVSIQTDYLDTQPKMRISCDTVGASGWEVFSHGEVMSDSSLDDAASSPAMLLAKPVKEKGGLQLVWFVEPTDQRHAEWLETGDSSQGTVELFGHFMEKGVIRRARMRAFVIQSELNLDRLRELYIDFANSPLPLTA